MAPILGIIHILSLLLYQQGKSSGSRRKLLLLLLSYFHGTVPVLQATGTSTALDRTGIT